MTQLCRPLAAVGERNRWPQAGGAGDVHLNSARVAKPPKITLKAEKVSLEITAFSTVRVDS
ncbi:MAG: hypothetical protein HY553_02990 [Elusimicrobia bacterium]|nr:hypothetical protein [Elusimicrobiota bacterium]